MSTSKSVSLRQERDSMIRPSRVRTSTPHWLSRRQPYERENPKQDSHSRFLPPGSDSKLVRDSLLAIRVTAQYRCP